MLSTRIKNLKLDTKGSEPNSARRQVEDSGPIIYESSFTAELYEQARPSEQTMIEEKKKEKGAQETQNNLLDQTGGNSTSKSQLPINAMTDPNSIYRKLYNRDLQFFLWVI